MKKFLNTVCEQIKYKPIRETITEELKNHIEEAKESYIEEGLKEDLAEAKAIEQMGEAEEIGKKLNQIHRPKFDWKLVLLLLGLLVFGALVAWIRTSHFEQNERKDSIQKFIFFLVLGFIGSIGIYFVNYKKTEKYSNVFYILATISILWSMLFGVSFNGRPYLRIPGMIGAVSPAVIAMPLYIIAYVGFFNGNDKKTKIELFFNNRNISINVSLVKIIVLSLLSLVFLACVSSLTSALVVGMVYFILANVKIWSHKENRKKHMIQLWSMVILLGLLGTMYMVTSSETNAFRLSKIEAFLHPEENMQGFGWLAINRKLIIQSANSWGEANNMSNALDLFDEGTNYSFISILAHCGWIITLGVILVVFLFSIKLILNARKIKDSYGKFLTIGIASMFILQSVFNILMNLNLCIQLDFNLPFVSYGGANLIINMLSLALLLSIYRRKDIIMSH